MLLFYTMIRVERDCNTYLFVGGWKEAMRQWEKKVEKATRMPKEVEPPVKVFNPVNSNVPVLEEYEGVLGEEYWGKWQKNPYRKEKGSLISHEEIRKVAEEMNFREEEKVEEIADMLEHGADLGVCGEGRLPSVEKNNPSVYKYGARVADAIQTGVKDGILYGPLRKEEIPWECKVSPMTVRLKPNGNARIIMDLSAPHGPKLGGGEPCSPNEGMKGYEEFEAVKMASDVQWRRCLHWVGRPCEMVKADWDMAYKHVSVRPADHKLQVVEFMGRYFIEKCLTFGGGNSPTLYHLPASLLKDWAEIRSGQDSRSTIMQLDDNCACGRKGCLILRKYRKEYRELADRVGVRLASEDNPTKAFPPSVRGEILGREYDCEAWTWRMPVAKSDRLLVLLGKGIKQGTLLNEEAMVLAGKINHYASMVQGKFERSLIIHLVEESEKKEKVVVVGKQARSQMVWWLLNLRALSLAGAFIPDPNMWFMQGALQLYPDAAGGDTSDLRKGWGCCCPQRNEVVYGAWPGFIHKNEERNGETWGRRLTVLEGYGGGQGLPVWVEAIVEAGGVALFIDNSGFVYAYTKGSSRCEFIYTLAKYVSDFCRCIGVQAKIFHTGRRTSVGERVADALSKGNFKEVQEEMPGAVDVSHRTSEVLRRWINDPRVDRALARRVLNEVASRVEVFQERDMVLEMESILREKRLE